MAKCHDMEVLKDSDKSQPVVTGGYDDSYYKSYREKKASTIVLFLSGKSDRKEFKKIDK